MTTSNNTIATNMSATTSKKITKQIVQQQLMKKQPDVDKERPSVELYSAEYRDQRCIPHSTNVKSYVL